MKITPMDTFTIEHGGACDFGETMDILRCNGFLVDDFMKLYPYAKYIFIGSMGMGLVNSKTNIHYTPAEFRAKYGDVLTPIYPFELVGEAFQHGGKWLRYVDSSKPMILDGIKLIGGNYNGPEIAWMFECIAIVDDINPFITRGMPYRFAWAEVDQPEPKTITRPMNAQEIRDLMIKTPWVKFGEKDLRLNSLVERDHDGQIRIGGYSLFRLSYAWSSAAIEWIPFTVTEVIK